MSCSDQTAPDIRADIRPDVRVQIKYLSALRDTLGRRVEKVTFSPGATLHDVVAWLNERYALSLPNPQVMAIMNGTGWDQLPRGLATELEDGDAIALFPPIAGG